MWIYIDEDEKEKITSLEGRRIKILNLLPPDCYSDERRNRFIGRTGTIKPCLFSPFLQVDLDTENTPRFAFRRIELEFIDDPDENY